MKSILFFAGVTSSLFLWGQGSFVKKFTDFSQTALFRQHISETSPTGKTFITFAVNKSGVNNIGLLAYDANGNQQVSMTYESSLDKTPVAITQEKNNVIIAGWAKKVNGHDGVFVLKTDTTGSIIWFKTFANTDELIPRCIATDGNGNIVIGGSYNPWNYSGQPMRAFYLLLNSNGDIITFDALNTTKNYPDFSAAVKVNEGGFILSGQLGHLWDYYSAFTIKINTAGKILWSKTYRMDIPPNNYNLWSAGSRSTLSVLGGTQISPDRFMLAGYSSDHDQYGTYYTYYDGFILTIDANGNLLQGKRLHHQKRTQFTSAQYFNNGTVGITGYTDEFTAGYFGLFDTLGNNLSEIDYRPSTAGYNSIYAAGKTANNKYWLAGASENNGNYFPTLTVMDFTDKGCNNQPVSLSPVDLTISTFTVDPSSTGTIQEYSASVSSVCICETGTLSCGSIPSSTIDVIIKTKYSDCEKSVMLAEYDKTKLKCGHMLFWTTGSDTSWTDSLAVTQDSVVISAHVSAGNCQFKSKDTIIPLNTMSLDLGNDIVKCDTVNEITLDALIQGGKYNWSTGDTSRQIKVKYPGEYRVEVSKGICNTTDSIRVNFKTVPKSFGPDQTVCTDDSVILISAAPLAINKWSVGITAPSIMVKQQGTYILETTDSGCTQKDTINIAYLGEKHLADIDSCARRPTFLDAGNPGSSYLWSTGENTRYINFPGEGKYWVHITLKNCDFYDSITVYPAVEDFYLYVPSAFTPDNNNLNDTFALTERGVSAIRLIIFDRWGEIIFNTTDKNFRWDGIYHNAQLPDGTYFYEILYTYECGTIPPAIRGPLTIITR